MHTRFELGRPLDLALTIAPIGQGVSLRLRDREAWRATLTPEGPATVHVVHVGGAVEVEAWGPGAGGAAEGAAARGGGEADDSGFRPAHPLLADLHRRHPGLRLPKTRAVFEALVPTVLAQKVVGEEAHRSYRALVHALGEPAPGPAGLTVPPSATVLAGTPYWTFHKFGIERRRAEVIIRAARSATRLEEILTMDLVSARRRLVAFPGVGPWTAAKVALVALGDADAVQVGDYHLPHAVGYALEGTPRSSDERMLELLELLLDQVDELAHAFGIEDQFRAGSLEQLGQRPGRAKGQGLAVLAHGFFAVVKAVPPHLQGAKLRDPVLDVIERAREEVRLHIPAGDALAVESRPVDGGALEATPELEPLAVARIRVAPRVVEVDPLLEGVD